MFKCLSLPDYRLIYWNDASPVKLAVYRSGPSTLWKGDIALDNCKCSKPCGTPVSPCFQDQPQVVGMAYVPWQHLNTVYEAEKGFARGTIFPELDKPWLVGGGSCRG